MTIKINETIPTVTIKILTSSGPEDVSTSSFFQGKTTVLVGVPGAFTPVCTQKHIPEYGKLADKLKEKGIDQIACVAINDPFVMNAWAEHMGVASSVQMLSDWQGDLIKALGLDIDLSVAGLGTRASRFAMIVKDNKVVDLQVDASPQTCDISSAHSILGKLKTLAA